MIPGGGGLSTSNSTSMKSASEGTQNYVQDNTFVVGGQASVDKGDTGLGGGGGDGNTLLIVGVGAVVLLAGMFMLRR